PIRTPSTPTPPTTRSPTTRSPATPSPTTGSAMSRSATAPTGTATATEAGTMAERRHGDGGSRLQEVIRRLQEARTRAPRGSDAAWPGPVADSGAPVGDGGTATEQPERGEFLWRPFNPKALERTRPFRTAPPSRDEFESHLSQFLGTRAKRTGPLFRAQGVSVRYGAVAACTDVDLELLGIEALADQPVARLSPGEQRLVDLARALAADPRLAILDEPAAGLAKHDRRDLAERIGMVCDEMGIAVLLTGQDFPAITNL